MLINSKLQLDICEWHLSGAPGQLMCGTGSPTVSVCYGLGVGKVSRSLCNPTHPLCVLCVSVVSVLSFPGHSPRCHSVSP